MYDGKSPDSEGIPGFLREQRGKLRGRLRTAQFHCGLTAGEKGSIVEE